MSRKRVIDDHNEEGFDEIETEENEGITNEYELQRAARVASNNVYLQSCLAAADAL